MSTRTAPYEAVVLEATPSSITVQRLHGRQMKEVVTDSRRVMLWGKGDGDGEFVHPTVRVCTKHVFLRHSLCVWYFHVCVHACV